MTQPKDYRAGFDERDGSFHREPTGADVGSGGIEINSRVSVRIAVNFTTFVGSVRGEHSGERAMFATHVDDA